MADPDLQIRGEGVGGGGHSDPEIREDPVFKKFFFSLCASFWCKNKGGGGGASRDPPLDLPLLNRLNPGVISSLRADTLNLVHSYMRYTICDTWAGCTAG